MTTATAFRFDDIVTSEKELIYAMEKHLELLHQGLQGIYNLCDNDTPTKLTKMNYALFTITDKHIADLYIDEDITRDELLSKCISLIVEITGNKNYVGFTSTGEQVKVYIKSKCFFFVKQ